MIIALLLTFMVCTSTTVIQCYTSDVCSMEWYITIVSNVGSTLPPKSKTKQSGLSTYACHFHHPHVCMRTDNILFCHFVIILSFVSLQDHAAGQVVVCLLSLLMPHQQKNTR